MTINIQKLFRKFTKSQDRTVGIEVSSKIRGLKYILKGDSLIFTTIENGVFAISLNRIEDFADEIVEIATMYESL